MTDDDERYLKVEGRRWRKADPAIPASLKSELVSELMSARRAVRTALDDDDPEAERAARRRVNDAKIALGERGRAWWLPANQKALRIRLAAAVRALLTKRGPGKSICPSDAARIAAGAGWRGRMPLARDVACELAADGTIELTQRGRRVQPPLSGAVRLTLPDTD